MRLAVVRDFRAEQWPSMDLCADQLLAHLPRDVTSEDVALPFRRVASRIPFAERVGFNVDRLLNRHVLLPQTVSRAARRADFVHIVDHSYAHIVSVCPIGRAGVYCHDLDAFRSLLEPDAEPRPWWFRRLAQRKLEGLKRAAVVFHSTIAVRKQILKFGLVEEDKLIHAPFGIAATFTLSPSRPIALSIPVKGPYLLHVGSDIRRKRLDILLAVFAEIRRRFPDLSLIQVGGTWSSESNANLVRLGLTDHVFQVRDIPRDQLAELYRRAVIVLQPSEAEGFGFPVIEALACGAIVVASDIPVLREVGGDAVLYCPVGDVAAWAEVVSRVLSDASSAPQLQARLAWSTRYSWTAHARTIADAYLSLAD